jgi:hypothetical protein
MGEMTGTNIDFVGKHDRKRPLGILRRRCEDNISMDLEILGREDVDWIHLTEP